ncbi:MAG TPA: hypothetical protein VFT43_09625 [Candidatus Polarisedimenticolia bacterium]|nr:hypothetical protein [Candidatus Polarisedimenticolia bacterium]
MSDTPPDVLKRYHEMLMARSGAARLRMGCDLFMAARRLALAGLKAESPHDLPARLFLRFYGREFSPGHQAAIVARIRGWAGRRSFSSSAR